ncbi:MAG: hypothetical protein WAO56_11705 [Miniphocaeibacter sp.]|uniref:hypothetical protein n=1 Tax=Miniphocaeibacter sp. TaxID=3100973 RepID=UPI0017FFF3BA|nr:hypothetical protein [Gallicola sp.]
MDRFFEILKEENPQLILNIYDSLENLEKCFNMAQTYDLDLKNHREIKEFYDNIVKIKSLIPVEGIQLSLEILSNEKVFSKSVNLLHDFSYTKPKSYSIYRGKNIEVSSFKELYEQILFYLYKIDKEKLHSLINKTKFNGRTRPYFDKDSKKMINPIRISQNLYAETHFSSNKFRDMLIKIFNLYNIDINNLRIYIKQDKKEKYGYYK